MALVHLEVNDSGRCTVEEECCELDIDDATFAGALKRLIDAEFVVTVYPMDVWLK